MTAPRYAVEALGPNVALLRAGAVRDAVYLVRDGIKATNPNSVHMPRFRALLAELAKAFEWGDTSPERHHDVVSLGAEAESDCQDGATDWITTHDAARLLGRSVRQIQRLAPALGRWRAGRWELDRRAVLALKTFREQETDDDRADAA